MEVQLSTARGCWQAGIRDETIRSNRKRRKGELPRIFRTGVFGPNSRCELLILELVPDLVRRFIAKLRVASAGIVAELDVSGNVTASVFPRRVDGTVDPLVLQRCEERFGHRVVVADAGPTDGLANSQFLQSGAVVGRGVLLPRSEWKIASSANRWFAAAIRTASSISGVR